MSSVVINFQKPFLSEQIYVKTKHPDTEQTSNYKNICPEEESKKAEQLATELLGQS